MYKIVKQNILKIMKQDARVISCGFDSTGMSKSRGFIKTKILLVNHGGDHNDSIILVEDRIQAT